MKIASLSLSATVSRPGGPSPGESGESQAVLRRPGSVILVVSTSHFSDGRSHRQPEDLGSVVNRAMRTVTARKDHVHNDSESHAGPD